MLIDTHCHINMMIKQKFDQLLSISDMLAVQEIISDASHDTVNTIINVGTSLIESINSIKLAQQFPQIWATVGIHPNDCTSTWKHDFKEIYSMVKNKHINKIVGIGECGMDFHYPDYNIQRQKDAFKAHIELALEYDLALVVHTRDAREETLSVLEEFVHHIKRGVIHCFSEDVTFAHQAITWNFVVGIGGTLTYPKNEILRTIAKTIPLEKIVLETDAPFLPLQSMRGKKNHPKNIKIIAQFLADIRQESFEKIAQQTTLNSLALFQLNTEKKIV